MDDKLENQTNEYLKDLFFALFGKDPDAKDTREEIIRAIKDN